MAVRTNRRGRGVCSVSVTSELAPAKTPTLAILPQLRIPLLTQARCHPSGPQVGTLSSSLFAQLDESGNGEIPTGEVNRTCTSDIRPACNSPRSCAWQPAPSCRHGHSTGTKRPRPNHRPPLHAAPSGSSPRSAHASCVSTQAATRSSADLAWDMTAAFGHGRAQGLG